jgi:hypothetical protein
MKHWRWLLIGSLAAATIACGLLAWRVALASPYALLPADAADVRVERRGMARYQVSYQAAAPFFEWRDSTIERYVAAGWVRGRRPDSSTIDRTLWFVRRSEAGVLTIIEQVSIRATDAPAPPVVLRYQRTVRFLNRSVL